MATHIEITGVEEVRRAFEELPEHVRDNIEKRVIRKAAQRIVDAAKSYSPRDTGAFIESQGMRVKSYPATGKVMAIVGPRRGSGFTHGANIAHLIESGFRVGRGGTLAREGRSAAKSKVTGERGKGVAVRYVRGKRVMKRAFLATRDMVQAELERGLEKTVNAFLLKSAKAKAAFYAR